MSVEYFCNIPNQFYTIDNTNDDISDFTYCPVCRVYYYKSNGNHVCLKDIIRAFTGRENIADDESSVSITQKKRKIILEKEVI